MKCNCGEKSTGYTTIRCCNICGLPLPDEPWKFQMNEKLYIGVEHDLDQGWILTIPKIYDTGIEHETEFGYEFFRDALEDAETFSKNTGIPIRKWNKQGEEIFD